MSLSLDSVRAMVTCALAACGLSLTQTAHALDSTALAAFLDGYLPTAMAERHIPGLAITVVEGETPIFVRSYGVMDVDTQRAVDPRTTLFDVQSVAKLIVSTATLIAAERAQVRLDRDVDTYLKDVAVPKTFSEPITLAALLTHTSGLEDRGIGITARTAHQIEPLGEYLSRSLTARVAPPFTRLVYSDQGMTLAAHTVESATGVPFDAYAQRAIFSPLDMRNTFYREVPPSRAGDRATGYAFDGGTLVPIPHMYYRIWPSSSLWSTAADMGRFVATHLQDGELGGVRIASVATMQRLHSRQFGYEARMPGVCFDFFERFDHGRRLLTHSGGGSGFISELTLVPDARIGYFVTYNASDGSLLGALRDVLLNRLVPAADSHAPAIRHMTADELAAYTGWYWSTRYDRHTLDKLTSLVDGYADVNVDGDGLDIAGRRFLPVSSKLFIDEHDGTVEYVAFERNATNQVTTMLPAFAAAPYTRVSWPYSQRVQFGVVVISMLVFVIVLVSTAASLIRNGTQALKRHRERGLAAMIAAGQLFCFAALAAQLAKASSPVAAVEFELGISATLRALLVAISFFSLLSLALPVAVARTWSWQRQRRAWTLLTTLTSGAAIAYVWFLYTWNIVGV